MSILTKIKGWLPVGNPQGKSKAAMDVRAWLAGNETTGLRMVNAMKQSVWVHACVSTLADAVANVPFRFESVGKGPKKRKGHKSDGEPVESGGAVDLFAQPHPELSASEFWETLVGWLMLAGKAYLVATDKAGMVVNLERGGKIQRLVPVNPAQVRVIWDNHRTAGYQLLPNNDAYLEPMLLLPEEVIRVRLTNVFDPTDGLSPLQVAMLAAETDYTAAQFMKGFISNNADTGLIATTDQQLSDEQRKQLREALMARKRGGGTPDRPMILDGGLKVSQPAISSTDMQFLENRKYSRQEICAVFKVPQELLGYTEDANRSVSDAQRLNFIENRVAPLCKRLEDALQPVVEALQPGVMGYFDIDSTPVMQAARRSRVDVAAKLWSMGVPFADLNQDLDLGYPDRDWHNLGYLPFSVQPAGGKDESGNLKPEEGTGGRDEGGNLKPEEGTGGKAAAACDEVLAKLKEVREQMSETSGKCGCGKGHPGHEAEANARAKLMGGQMRRVFFEQRQRVLSQLSVVSEQLSAGAENQKAVDPNDLWDPGFEDQELWKRVKPQMIGSLEAGGAKLWKEIGAPGEFMLRPERAVEFFKERANAISGINETTFNAIRDQVKEGVANGESYNAIADRIKAVFNEASSSRAETIAHTETNISINAGRFEGMKSAGVTRKRWITSGLENTRASHIDAAERSQEGIPLEEPFANGLMHPGDPSGLPEETINCRCTVVAVKS